MSHEKELYVIGKNGISGEFHRLKAASVRLLEQEFSLAEVLDKKEKELEWIKNSFQKKW